MLEIAEQAVSGSPLLVSKESGRLPLVSVCIANYNGASIISGCIESVLAQDFDFPIEILVHDDASLDDSAALVESDYPGVHLIRSESNVGFCIANNRMVSVARGEFILLLNNDAELFTDALLALLTESRLMNKSSILSLPQYDHASAVLIDRGCLLDPFFNPVPNMDPVRRNVGMVIGACMWLPRNIWHELGGFPEWIGSIGEDLYLCCRARLVGIDVCVLSVSGYRHRVGASFGGGKPVSGRLSTTFRRRYLSERNKTFVMLTTCPAPWVMAIFPFHLVLLLIEGVFLTMLSQRMSFIINIYFPVFLSLWGRWSVLLCNRRAVMSQRKVGARSFFSTFHAMPYKLRMLFRFGLPELR